MIAERYTAVFTGFLSIKKPGEYPYLTVGAPYVEKSSPLRCGRPQRERLKRELPFRDLPEGCRHLVLEAYRELWGI